VLGNALAYRTPRERFWNDSGSWPDDTATHQFVGRLILAVGPTVGGPEWSDADPATTIPTGLSETLSIYTPASELRRAYDVLWMRDRPPGTRPPWGMAADPFPEIPTRAEWAIAREIVAKEIAEAEAKYYRFVRICLRLVDFFKQGTFVAATRPFAGGDLTHQPWHFWNTEQAWARFNTCRVNPNDHFDKTPAETGGLWLFFENKMSEAAIAEATTKQPPITDAQLAESVKPRPRKRGPKEKFRWETLYGEFLPELAEAQSSENPNISELARQMADRAAEIWLEPPEEKTIQEKLRNMFLRRQ
jgi:hypothetical protein